MPSATKLEKKEAVSSGLSVPSSLTDTWPSTAWEAGLGQGGAGGGPAA